jgi:hypothetical protein
MHIPKTAGTSLRAAAEKQYARDRFQVLYPCHGPQIEAFVEAARLVPPAAVMGHFRFGLHERLSSGGSYVTFFRKPVDQVISHLNYIARADDSSHDSEVKACRSLEEFLRHPWARNLQTQFVTGLTAEEIERDPVKALQLAEVHLDRHFVWFGVTETFDESLRELAALVGWQVARPARLNRGADHPQAILRSEVPPKLLAQVAEANSCDLELYSHVLSTARRRFRRKHRSLRIW